MTLKNNTLKLQEILGTGGGGHGRHSTSEQAGGKGGSGIVVIRNHRS